MLFKSHDCQPVPTRGVHVLTWLKRSPTILAIMIVSAIGKTYVMFVVHSSTMTVIEMVIREMPPSIAAAPMSAKLPGGLVE